MLLSAPVNSTVRRKPHSPNKKKPKETGTAASFSSSSSTVVLSSNNDGSFDALWDPSISKASDFESSYISAKRLKPESSNRQKKKNSYKYSREENTTR